MRIKSILPLHAIVCLVFLMPVFVQTSPSLQAVVYRDLDGNLKRFVGGMCDEVVIEQAVTETTGAATPADIRGLFSYHLRLRGEAVPESDKPKYWRELKAKPELRNTTVYGPESEQSRAVSKKLKPILELFGRDWDVAVIEQDEPFSGAFRQSIYIVSTGLLGMITDEELRSFAAHELAHECFIDELREADRTGCLRAYHLVEFKCDLVATLACLLLKDDPLSIVSGITRVETYYLNVDPSVLRENKHPKAQHRQCCVEKFLTRIRHGASAASRHCPEEMSYAEIVATGLFNETLLQ